MSMKTRGRSQVLSTLADSTEIRRIDDDLLWEPWVGLQLSLNTGALFGFGAGQVWLFVTLSFVAAIAIPIWLFALRAALDTYILAAMGLVTGGILGNLYDRLGLHGLTWATPDERFGQRVYAVRDWILFQWSDELRWPNFNVADSLLVCGVALLGYHAFVTPAVEPPRKSPSDHSSSSQ